ncbi:MAG: glycosyltransferase family 2 protein [Planctomycetes bacterium]|nr:glycosyltransferase family 2 protein [Planctomycetota bacterium]
MDSAPDLSIIIPVYNEAGVIDKVLPGMVQEFESWPYSVELLIINDGSSDGFDLKPIVPWMRVIEHAVNMGNGAAVKTGIRNAKSDHCLIMDGDGQHLPQDALKLVKQLDRFHLIVGARDFSDSGTLHRNIANVIYSKLASYVSSFNIEDLTSGMRAFRKNEVMDIIHLFPNRFSCPTTMTLGMLRLGYQVKFEPIDVQSREGTSKINILSDGFRFLLIILKISTLFSPLKIFLPVSLLLFGIGMSFYIYILFAAQRFEQWSIVLLTNAVTIFMIGLVAEEISSLKLKKEK